MKKLTKKIFCAGCQDVKEHELAASSSGEVVATCPECGRVLKFPAGIDKTSFEKAIEAHEEANKGQVSLESIESTLAELAD
jgi:uncharacterized Zn finger protein